MARDWTAPEAAGNASSPFVAAIASYPVLEVSSIQTSRALRKEPQVGEDRIGIALSCSITVCFHAPRVEKAQGEQHRLQAGSSICHLASMSFRSARASPTS